MFHIRKTWVLCHSFSFFHEKSVGSWFQIFISVWLVVSGDFFWKTLSLFFWFCCCFQNCLYGSKVCFWVFTQNISGEIKLPYNERNVLSKLKPTCSVEALGENFSENWLDLWKFLNFNQKFSGWFCQSPI